MLTEMVTLVENVERGVFPPDEVRVHDDGVRRDDDRLPGSRFDVLLLSGSIIFIPVFS